MAKNTDPDDARRTVGERMGPLPAIDRRAFASATLLGLLCGRVGSLGSVAAAGEPSPRPRLLVDEQLKASSKAARLSMQFRGRTAEEFLAWKRTFRAKLVELLGDIAPPRQLRVVEEGRAVFEGYTRYDLLLQAAGVPDVPVYLLVPQGASVERPKPGVLAVHGHGRFGNDPIVGRIDLPGVEDDVKAMNYDYGLQLVRRGYVVAAPCMIPFGRRVDREKYGGNDPCAVTLVRMQAFGQLPMAANLRDLRWCIDLLQSRPEVKQGGVGCVGLSYGGRMTMLVSALDERVKVAAVSGALNLLQERMTLRHSCGSQIIPGLLRYGDYSEIGSLIAPRRCVWEVGSKDPLITPDWADLFKRRLQRAYKALGATDKLEFDHFEGAHRWSGAVAFPLLDRTLKDA